MSEQSVINAFLICLFPSADDVQTSPAQVHGAKVQKNNELNKESEGKDEFLHLNSVIGGWYACKNAGEMHESAGDSAE